MQANLTQDLRRRSLLIVSWLVVVLAQSRQGASEQFPTVTWRTGSPGSQGLDSAVLAQALNYVRADHIPLHSFFIVRNGVMVLEVYFYPYLGREVHDVASVAKSFTSAAVGIAIEKGLIKDVDERVLSILPLARADPDPRKRSLAIRHLLTMTSGWTATRRAEKRLSPQCATAAIGRRLLSLFPCGLIQVRDMHIAVATIICSRAS